MAIIDSRSDAKFDALIRTNKADSLLSFIMATYNVKKTSNRKDEVALRLKSAYELFRENIKGSDSGAGSYGQGDRDIKDQFESHYTMGYEMGIWQDSDFTLNPLAIDVANYKITVSEYIGTVFTNLFTYYTVNENHKYHHFLYEILNRAKQEKVVNGIIPKSLIVDTLPIEKSTEQGNMIFNYLIATNMFDQIDKDSFILTADWKNKVDYLISICNLEYQNVDYDKSLEMAKDKKMYAAYVTKRNESPYLYEDLKSNSIIAEDANKYNVNFDVDRIPGGSNVLLYGVPGSGKSWTIEHEYCKKDSNVERLVFHPDYTYSDFIGQILPNVAEDGQVSYKFTPGPFTNILNDAYRNPDKEYILIIEEINRGNAPAIFGEVFQLLDRKTEIQEKDDDGLPIGTSEYGITNANIAKIVYSDPRHKVRIPSNLSIIGTMNTSDQNVFTLDTAFQRRWDMRLIENNFDNVDKELADAKILDTTVTWRNFCTAINDVVIGNSARMTSSEDKRLGAYFVHLRDLQMDENMGDLKYYDELRKKESAKTLEETEETQLEIIRAAMKQNRKFPEKVIKYLWDDAFKFNREIVFETSEYQSLEQVIRAFMYAEGLKRFDMFKENIKSAFTNTEN